MHYLYITSVIAFFFKESRSGLYLGIRGDRVILTKRGINFDVEDFKGKKRYKKIEYNEMFMTKEGMYVRMRNKLRTFPIRQRMVIVYTDENKYFIKRGDRCLKRKGNDSLKFGYCNNNASEFYMCTDKHCRNIFNKKRDKSERYYYTHYNTYYDDRDCSSENSHYHNNYNNYHNNYRPHNTRCDDIYDLVLKGIDVALQNPSSYHYC